jgi:4-hydroxyphenylpyruvate dioxygenase
MQDTFPIRSVDHLKFYCGNAKQTAYWYHKVFGFDITAYAGLETGNRDEAAYLLTQGEIKFLIASPLRPGSAAGEMVGRHGDFVRDLAFEVDDVDKAFADATQRGAIADEAPKTLEDSFGKVRVASIKTYGDVVHSFVNRDHFSGPFLPNFQPKSIKGEGVGLEFVDHVVGNVELNMMNVWVDWYAKVLDFSLLATFDDKDISTDYTALMSKVMQSGNGRVKMPINEPAEGKKKSQIDEYLEFHGGPGVQHIALHTADLPQTIKALRERGLEFLAVPKTYYDTVFDRVGSIDNAIDEIADLGILVDRDEEGYLLQLFTRPVEDRPSLFYEFIERNGAKSFGKGNFKALFEAIEREQAIRGTL